MTDISSKREPLNPNALWDQPLGKPDFSSDASFGLKPTRHPDLRAFVDDQVRQQRFAAEIDLLTGRTAQEHRKRREGMAKAIAPGIASRVVFDGFAGTTLQVSPSTRIMAATILALADDLIALLDTPAQPPEAP